MRWDNLKIEGDDGTTLPGYRDPARVRTFDAPEALDTRFYEVRAKSAINKVPKQSQVPFAWTINPYRGCSHACTYCLAGDTPILMADGKQRAIADLRLGDRIMGTAMRGNRRRYVNTSVRDHWTTEKPAFRMKLAGGTELITSGDHRFLSKSGWRHVLKSEPGDPKRPHLRVGSRLVGMGRFADPPVHNNAYRRGYLTGVFYGSAQPEQPMDVEQILDPRWMDLDVYTRARDYLLNTRVPDHQRRLTAAGAYDLGEVSYDEWGGDHHDLIRWPLVPSEEWRQGFLAGLFDANSWNTPKALEITPSDPAVVGWAHSCLEHFGFDVVVERRKRGVPKILIRGGLSEQLRFVHSFDPALGLRPFDDMPVATADGTQIVSIEPLGQTMRLYDITTGTGDFIADGVVSHNCFARPTHKYLDMDAGRDFEKQIIVKVNVPEVVRAELARPSWKGEHIAMGTNTDPYQWVEGRYKLMPGIWEAMRDFRNPCSILSKSPLVLRDLPLLKEVAAVTTITANLSVPTLDEGAWRSTEPHTPSPRARLEAVKELNANGIPCGVLIAPLMPGINDDPRQVEKIIELATEAGAVGISGIALHLRGDVRRIFFDWLKSERPDLVPQYERLYARGAYAPPEVRRRLHQISSANGIGPRRYLRDVEARLMGEREAEEAKRGPEPALQESLF